MNEWVSRAIVWLVRKIGGRSLFLLLTLGGVLSSIASAVQGSTRQLDQAPLIGLVWLAMVGGWLLARSSQPAWKASLAGLASGVAVLLIILGQLSGRLLLLAQLAIQSAWDGLRWIAGGPPPGPAAQGALSILQDIAQSVWMLLTESYTWLDALWFGEPFFDRLAATLWWGLALWVVALWAAWLIRRQRQPLAAMLPGGVLLAVVASYSGASALFFAPLLAGLLLILAVVNFGLHEQSWRQRDIDIAEDIVADHSLWLMGFVVIVVSLALAVSNLSPQKALKAVRDLARPRPQAVQQAGEALGLLEGGAALPFGASEGGTLPRQRLLGSGPELSQEIVMMVQVDGLATGDPDGTGDRPPTFYWRSASYDIYTGQGWMTSPTTRQELRANHELLSTAPPGWQWTRLRIQPANLSERQLFHAGELASASVRFAIDARPSNPETLPDLYSATLLDSFSAAGYRVDSIILQTGQAQLRAAGDEYPEWVRQRYLQLPPDLPERLVELAVNITSQALTPFDRALALEGYLRQFSYTLDVPIPPQDQDVADYFLFDLQQGYCDYYATSMAVLGRIAGLPTRLVIGYAQGTFDPQRGSFLVSQAEAHSWVEVYFPGLGWAIFEPTAGLPVLERPANLPAQPPTALPPAPIERPVRQAAWLLWAGAIIIVAGLLLLVGFTLDQQRLQRLPPGLALASLYRRLYSHIARLGQPLAPGTTPHEIAGVFEQHLARLERNPVWRKFATRLALRIAQGYAQAIYGPVPLTHETQEQALRDWQRLRPRLWIARLMNVIQRIRLSIPLLFKKKFE